MAVGSRIGGTRVSASSAAAIHQTGRQADAVAADQAEASSERADRPRPQTLTADHNGQRANRDQKRAQPKDAIIRSDPVTTLSIPAWATPSPVTNTTSPASSAGRTPRRTRRKRDSTISTRAATMIKPATIGRPPACTAIRQPGTQLLVGTGVISRPDPTGPQRRICKNVLTPSANVVSEMKLLA